MSFLSEVREKAERDERERAEKKNAKQAAKVERRDALARELADKRGAKTERKAQAAFTASPEGQARIAHQRGDQWLEIEMEMRETGMQTSYANVSHDRDAAVVTDRISPIEAEGWDLTTAQYVYVMTGQDSREKAFPGMRSAVQGRLVGIYLFKRRELEAAA